MSANMWQEDHRSNVDAQHPFIMRVCLSPEMPVVVQAPFRFEQQPFRVDTPDGILTTPSVPTGVRLIINGVDVTGHYGPFESTTIVDLDIAKNLSATGWNEIAIQSETAGRIDAHLFVHVGGATEGRA